MNSKKPDENDFDYSNNPFNRIDDPSIPANFSPEKLIGRYFDYYAMKSLDSKAITTLREEHLPEENIRTSQAIAFCDGSMSDLLRGNSEFTILYRQLGILNHDGREIYEGCYVRMLYDSQNIPVNIVGWKFNDLGKSVNATDMGMFNPEVLSTESSVFLSGCIESSVTLEALGFPVFQVMSRSLDEFGLMLRDHAPKEVFCVDVEEDTISKLREFGIAHAIISCDGLFHQKIRGLSAEQIRELTPDLFWKDEDLNS